MSNRRNLTWVRRNRNAVVVQQRTNNNFGRSGQITSLPNRRRRNRRRTPLNRNDARILALTRTVNRISQGIELKYIDTSISDSSASWNGSMGIFNDPSQDITDQSRVGDSIFCKWLEMRYRYDQNSSLSAGVRIIIFQDFENAFTAVNQVLGSTGSAQSLLSNYIWDTRFKRKILLDRVIHCDGIQQATVFGAIKIPLNFRVQFSSATTTITTNSLQILHITDVGATTYPIFSAAVRLAYNDA